MNNKKILLTKDLSQFVKKKFNKKKYDEVALILRGLAEQGCVESQKQLCKFYYCIPEQNYEQVIYWVRKVAEQGEIEGWWMLGFCYCNGVGVKESCQDAIYWYRKAAKQGYILAQYDLGLIYELSVEQDYNKARYWYKKAAKQADITFPLKKRYRHTSIMAKYRLGVLYEKGKGIEQNYREAKYWYEKAAQQGCILAQNDLGLLYAQGKIRVVDYKKARYWYEKAAKQGDIKAQKSLGLLYWVDKSPLISGRQSYRYKGIKPAHKKSIYWFKKAAKKGSIRACNLLGNLYSHKKNDRKAKYWYEKAAQQGNCRAQYLLSQYYKKIKNTEKEFYWLDKASKGGHICAQSALAQYYEIKGDYDMCIHWLDTAAKKGCECAIYGLNSFDVENKTIGKEQIQKLIDWNKKQIESGEGQMGIDGRLAWNLGIIYHEGIGVDKDIEEAIYWFRVAVDRDFVKAFDWLEKLLDKEDSVFSEYYQEIKTLRDNQPLKINFIQEWLLRNGERYKNIDWQLPGANIFRMIYFSLNMKIGYSLEYYIKLLEEYDKIKKNRKMRNQWILDIQQEYGGIMIGLDENGQIEYHNEEYLNLCKEELKYLLELKRIFVKS